ncbi:50S ribosomal protein L33 [Patescibacteria group bacterium]|nr:50S ribosomal protein L33 [Patescibacteria group bacterium]
MAKKGAREFVGMICSVCKSQNYITQRNKVNIEKKLELKKYCNKCRKQSLHKETTKLK